MFIQYFPQAYREMQPDQFNQLFKCINVDSLNNKDSLVHETRSSKVPCYRFYHGYADNGTMTLGSTGNCFLEPGHFPLCVNNFPDYNTHPKVAEAFLRCKKS